jgi:hypothetical protein
LVKKGIFISRTSAMMRAIWLFVVFCTIVSADFHAANRASSGGALAAGLPDLMTRRGS